MKLMKPFMIDIELLPFLKSKGNMSEYVNNLIIQARNKEQEIIKEQKAKDNSAVAWFDDEFKAIYQANKVKTEALYEKWLDERIEIDE